MRAANFKQANLILAKDQPQYNHIPAFYGQIGNSPEETGFFVCFELDDEDLKLINQNRLLWIGQLTFGKLFNPIYTNVTRSVFDPAETSVIESPFQLVAREWARVIDQKGYNAAHDAQFENGQLADAAALYAMTPEMVDYINEEWGNDMQLNFWGFDSSYKKDSSGDPAERIKDLVKSCVCAFAEIKRLQDLIAKNEKEVANDN